MFELGQKIFAGKEVQEMRLDRNDSSDSYQEWSGRKVSELRLRRLHVQRDPEDAEKDCLV